MARNLYNTEITLMEAARELFSARRLEMTEEDMRQVLLYSHWLADAFDYDPTEDDEDVLGATIRDEVSVDYQAIINEAGRGYISMKNEEAGELIRIMGEEKFRRFTGELASFIKSKGARVKSHYETVLKWYERAEGIAPRENKSDAKGTKEDAERSKSEGEGATGENADDGADKGNGNAQNNGADGAKDDRNKDDNTGNKRGIDGAENTSRIGKNPTPRAEKRTRQNSPEFEEANRVVHGYRLMFFTNLLKTNIPALMTKDEQAGSPKTNPRPLFPTSLFDETAAH